MDAGILDEVMTGYYSIVRYCPDMSRGEFVNVGVVLFVPSIGFFDYKLALSNYRVRRFFVEPSWNVVHQIGMWLAGVKETRMDRFKDEKEFTEFVETRANDIQLSKPLWVKVTRTPTMELDRLYERLVS